MFMSKPVIEVLEYLTESGKNPYRDWLGSIRDRGTAGVIQGRVARVEFGLIGDCRSVGGGVLELKIHAGPGYRVYFGFDGDSVVILLAGGDKKTQPMDIKRAQKYWQDYNNRK
jgi:putative addiction module killer protein